MIARAKASYIRISSRKANDVMELVRGKDVRTALDLLSNLSKKASGLIRKVIQSALTNAEQKGVDTMDTSSIVISRLVANPGPTLKRYRAATFGRANVIRKRTTHLEVELDMKK